jgi:hypothetical protein
VRWPLMMVFAQLPDPYLYIVHSHENRMPPRKAKFITGIQNFLYPSCWEKSEVLEEK